MRIPLVYKSGPVFGCDIGSQAVKIVELSGGSKNPKVAGYGYGEFNPQSKVQGIVSDPDDLAQTIKKILASPQAGQLKAERAAVSVPVSRVFIRTLRLPPMGERDLAQAIRLEAEQYIPVPLSDLYLDYQIVGRTTGKEAAMEVEMVAAPRAIIDSYIRLFDRLGIFVEAIEVSLSSIYRAMSQDASPTLLLIDFGSESADLVISERAVRLSSSIPVGGNTLTKSLVDSLGITTAQANQIKHKFGIASSGLQGQILKALEPNLKLLISEIKKAIKYYQDRTKSQSDITRIVISGGSSLMPGMVDYLGKGLGIEIVAANPWQPLDLKRLPQPDKGQQAMYTTAIGLALSGVKP